MASSTSLADDPAAVAPAVVRALVAAGADVVEVRVERTSLERIYFEVMGVRPGADGEARLMRGGIVGTVLRREWTETLRNRLLVLTIVVPPVVLTMAPMALAGLVGQERALPPELAASDPGPAARVGGVHRR